MSADALPTAQAPAPSGTEAIVCADIARRQAHGIAKYGTTVAENPLPLRQWLVHAYEEHLDAAVYLRRSIAEIDNRPPPDAASSVVQQLRDAPTTSPSAAQIRAALEIAAGISLLGPAEAAALREVHPTCKKTAALRILAAELERLRQGGAQ